MKHFFRFSLFTLVFLFISSFFVSHASAQGTYGCAWPPNPAPQHCYVTNIKCSSGTSANPDNCFKISNPASCNSASFSCQSGTTNGSLSCGVQGGACMAACGTGEIALKSSDCTQKCCRGIFGTSAGSQYCNSGGNPVSDTYSAVGLNTAFGCLKWETSAFLGQIFPWAIGIAGGIAFILILVAAFQIITAAGDPKKIKAGQELLTAVLTGVVLVVLSILLMNFIGVKLLNLPGYV